MDGTDLLLGGHVQGFQCLVFAVLELGSGGMWGCLLSGTR